MECARKLCGRSLTVVGVEVEYESTFVWYALTVAYHEAEAGLMWIGLRAFDRMGRS